MGASTPAVTPMIIATLFPTLAIFAVIARLWAARLRGRKFQFDDWVVLAALVACCGNGAVLIVAAFYGGLGQKQPLDPDGNPYPNPALEAFQKCIYANEIVSHVALALSRTAVLLMYTRIFSQQTYFRIIVCGFHTLNLTWLVALGAILVFQCWPISDVWKKTYGLRKHCIESGQITFYMLAISGAVMDGLILCLPWPYVWQLKLPMRQRLGVLGIFMLGALVLVAAVGKTWTFFHVGELITKDHQITYEESSLMYWTVPESCLAVVCACLPTLRPLFAKMSLQSVIEGVRASIQMLTPRSRKASQDSGVVLTCPQLAEIEHMKTWTHISSISRNNSESDLTFLTTPWPQKDVETGTGTHKIERSSSAVI